MNAPVTWFDERRSQAETRFRASGLPHRRIEDWKYTDLKAAVGEALPGRGDAPAVSVRNARGMEQYAFEDGTAPAWVKDSFGRIGPATTMSDASLAHAKHRIALRVPAGFASKTPVELELAGVGAARVLIVVEEGASVTLLETPVAGASGALSNTGIEIRLEANARVEHVRMASHLPGAIVVETIAVDVAGGACYRGHLMTTGAKLSRTELKIVLHGEGAEAHLSGVSVLGDEAHADVTTHIDHAVGDTQSTQLFKNVAGGSARAVYQGKITVRQGANGSDSRQTAKALLLGARAEADLKPELEILADDVKCAHGAAVGDLDPESLFYLRSRGIPEDEARDLLIHAFLEDAVSSIGQEEIRAAVRNAVERALPRATSPMP